MTRISGAAAMLVAGLASACSTSGGLEAVLDPQLPSSMALAPSSRNAARGGTGDLAVQSYAGPTPGDAPARAFGSGPVAARSPELDRLIAAYAAHYQVPERLVRRVVKRESNFDPAARNRIYWGLMQIRHDTARTMGYRGPAEGLLDAETNLKYAVRYLRGAYITAGGNEDLAVSYYARGYYYDAKRKGLLEATGLRG